MNIALSKKLIRTPDGQRCPSGRIFRWLGLLFGFFLVWVFMFIIAPWIERAPAVRPLTRFIEDTGIDAGALYYTEIDETADAEMYLHDAYTYAPLKK